jgi:pimeloyl-ACP methyl ester carboxylesterase
MVRRSLVVLIGVSVAMTSALASPGSAAIAVSRSSMQAQLSIAGRAGPSRPCGVGDQARCGRIRVPLDHADPSGDAIRISYQQYPRTDRSQPSLGTIVAIQGGPGYSTLNGGFYYHELYRPLLRRRSLLLVDLRGTGSSGPIDCRPLQTISPARRRAWIAAVGACGRSLGPASSLYTTAQAADDLTIVLDELGIDTVDLYGDSYGTFFAQSFATRHPDRLRSLVLDSAYPAVGLDPWATDWHDSSLASMRRVCSRDAWCSELPGGPIARIRRLNDIVSADPIVGVAPDGAGQVGRAVIDPDTLISLVSGAGYSTTAYRELDAAVRAALPPTSDPRPLLRRVREDDAAAGGGDSSSFSYGLYYATICTDYPQLYDMDAPPSQRRAEYQAALDDLELNDPGRFAPWSVAQWTGSLTQDYDSCLRWPIPDAPADPAVDPGATYPGVPTLVLAGDLDSVTTPNDAQTVAAAFPDATYIEVPNRVHITALADDPRCVSAIVQRFTRSLVVGDTSCVASYAPIRAVDEFARRVRDIDGPLRRRTAIAAANTVADVAARWWEMWAYTDSGLRGGSFRTWGWNQVNWKLDRVRWVKDLWVSGRAHWSRLTGEATAEVEIGGHGGAQGHLQMTWNDMEADAQMHVRGVLGGRRVEFMLPAP